MMQIIGEKYLLSETNLKAVQQEVIIGIGSQDRMVSYEESKSVASMLPNGKLTKLENSPHSIEQIPIDELTVFVKNSFL
ncbi:MAG: hypothetical protein JKY48_06220 [Flavobacteriales bacterium]|nr:hypothetical protein [Flavobacteriales bacterium]